MCVCVRARARACAPELFLFCFVVVVLLWAGLCVRVPVRVHVFLRECERVSVWFLSRICLWVCRSFSRSAASNPYPQGVCEVQKAV